MHERDIPLESNSSLCISKTTTDTWTRRVPEDSSSLVSKKKMASSRKVEDENSDTENAKKVLVYVSSCPLFNGSCHNRDFSSSRKVRCHNKDFTTSRRVRCHNRDFTYQGQ
jgi:hypothetical protein